MRSGSRPNLYSKILIPTSYGSSKYIMRISPRPHRSSKPCRTVSIIGTGSYAPERILTNHDLEKMVDTSDQWIRTRTGIRERRIAKDSETTSDMGTRAARSEEHTSELQSRQ